MSNTKKVDQMPDYDELPDGRLVCHDHKLVVCGKCCVDYSFMDDVLDNDQEGEESDGDELLTEEEMKAFRARMIAKKGCACILPLPGSGCSNCDPEMKDKAKTDSASKTGPEDSKVGEKSKPKK